MKFYALALLIAGAGFANVNASPLRVTITDFSTPSPIVAGNLHNADSALVPIGHVSGTNRILFGSGSRRPCGAMREKAITLSNGLRNILGLPPIEAYPFIGTPLSAIPPHQNGGPFRHGVIIHDEHQYRQQNHSNDSFPTRLLDAFMALKWWEGGAVAFVFGCGIGVLLRLLWVMAVVSYRVCRGESVDEIYHELPAHDDAEVAVLIAPPQYTENEKALDEKKELSPSA